MIVTASVRMQLVYLLRRPGQLAPLVVTPLYSLVFFAVARAHDASALTVTSLALTATTMAIWGHSVFVAGEVLDDDRYAGTLETFLAAPDGYRLSVVVRILTASVLAVVAFLEVLTVGRLTYGVDVEIRHVLVFVPALLVVALCAGATAVLLGAALVLTRAARTMQNAITYPVYVLAGMLLPRDSLPEALRLLSYCFPLSWAVDALRGAAVAQDASTPWTSLAVAVAFGVGNLVLGAFVLGRVLDRLREGTVSLHA